MLNHWVSRLVKSPKRRRKLLKKRTPAWPVLIQTGDQGRLKPLNLGRDLFPELVKVRVKLRPKVVQAASLTSQVCLDGVKYEKISIYSGQDSRDLWRYGRCESVDLIVERFENSDKSSVSFDAKVDGVLYRKSYPVCSEDIVDSQKTIQHRVVNATTQKEQLYPFGGFIHSSGNGGLGESVYASFSVHHNRTHLQLYRHDELRRKGATFSQDDVNYSYAFDTDDVHKCQSLEHAMVSGAVSIRGATKLDEDTWEQRYVSSGIEMLEQGRAVVTFRRIGLVEPK